MSFFAELVRSFFNPLNPSGTIAFSVSIAILLLVFIFRRKISASMWMLVGFGAQVVFFLFGLWSIWFAFHLGGGGYVYIILLTLPAVLVWLLLSFFMFYIVLIRSQKGELVPFRFVVYTFAILAVPIAIGILLLFGIFLVNG